MATYTIRTDGAMMDGIKATSVDEALAQFDESPADVRTPEQFRAWLERVGGYGWIEEDGERLVEVSAD